MTAGTAPAFHAFESALQMTHGLAELIAGRLGGALASRGAASLVVTGGSTVAPLYDRLSHARLAWDSVFLTLSDERWVAPDRPESNELLVRTHLLTHSAAKARFTSLKADAPSAQAAESKVNWAVAAMPRPFDVVLLGMGADGHVASLFSGGEGVEQAMDVSDPALVRAIRADQAAGSQERMSLTLRAILESRLIAVMIRGADKREAYLKALNGPGDASELPVRALLRQDRTPVAFYWAP
jgi:6-phosphogluconolactonase